MTLARNALALGVTTVLSVAACSSHDSTTRALGLGGAIGINAPTRGETGSVGMHLTIGNGVHVNQLNWTISNGTNTYSQTLFITDDGGHEAQSVEFVAGGIQAGSGYVITLSGSDTSGDPCTGSSQPVTVVAGATSVAQVVVTCTIPTDATVATAVGSGNISVDAGAVLVNQLPFVCPAITGISISPAEILSPQTASLSAGVTGSSGGMQTLAWSTSCPDAVITPADSPNATFACGMTVGGTLCDVTLTVGVLRPAADGGNGDQVCTGVGVSTMTGNILCEVGGTPTCIPPTPDNCSVDGGLACTNLQTDPNNCGSCGNVCPAGCCQGTCITGPPTPCTSAPCSSCGTNSVQCPANAANDGVCTQTEALLVAKDIAAGNLTAAGQLQTYVSATNNGSCYSCLNNFACLDDDMLDTGHECEDSPSTAGGPTACLTTLQCILDTDCQGPGGISGTSDPPSRESVTICYCGPNGGTLCAGSTVPSGLCDTQEAAGLGFPLMDSADILDNYGSFALPSGIANHIFQCAALNKCTICL
jgi:hypothetical protein